MRAVTLKFGVGSTRKTTQERHVYVRTNGCKLLMPHGGQCQSQSKSQ